MTGAAEFADLTQQEQIDRIALLGRAALSEFGVEPTSMTSLVHAENTTYRVESDKGTFCLRVCRPGYQSDANVASEIVFMAALRHAELGAPEPYQERVVKVGVPEVPEERNCVLLRWQPGEFRSEGYSPEDARKLGRLMAKLHAFSAAWTPPPQFDRQHQHEWLLSPRRGTPFDEPTPMASEEDRQLLLNVEKEVRQLLQSMPKDRDNFGVIHADMHHGNVLFEGDEVFLIDFDDTGWAFWLYDFAAALAFRVAKPGFVELREAFLAGYEEVRPLPPRTRELLGAFIQIRLLGIAHWVMDRLDNPRMRETGHEWIQFMCEGIRAAGEVSSVRS